MAASEPSTPAPESPSVDETRLMDVVFMIDATGSMSETIRAAHARAVEMAENLRMEDPKTDFRFASVCYRDPVDSRTDVHDVFQLSDQIPELTTFFSGIRATGGGDGPEDFVGAFRLALDTIQWRDGGRTLILIADAPAHGQRYCGHVNHQEEEPLLEPLVQNVAELGISLNMISLNGGADRTFDEIEKIYAAAGGPQVQKRSLALGRERAARRAPVEPLPGEVYVRCLDRTHETFLVEPTDTVGDLKAKLHDRVGVDAAVQELVFNGTELDDEMTLSACGVGKGCTLRMYQRGRAGGYYERYAARGSHRDYYDDVGDHMYSMTATSTRSTLERRYHRRDEDG
jgi:hypothetical protein